MLRFRRRIDVYRVLASVFQPRPYLDRQVLLPTSIDRGVPL
jgi:hypothetical protein